MTYSLTATTLKGRLHAVGSDLAVLFKIAVSCGAKDIVIYYK